MYMLSINTLWGTEVVKLRRSGKEEEEKRAMTKVKVNGRWKRGIRLFFDGPFLKESAVDVENICFLWIPISLCEEFGF